MSTASKGRSNEHKAREWLEELGYVVTRSAGSKGAWDLIGIAVDRIALAQVKTNEWPPPVERLMLETFPAPPRTRRLLFRFDDRKTVKVRELVCGEWVDVK